MTPRTWRKLRPYRYPSTLRWALTLTVVHSFGAAAKEDGRLFYNDAGFLLVLALADGALEGYRTFDDLREQVIPADRDEVPLRFKQEVLNLPIARKCTKSGGVTNDPMSKSQFEAIFRSSLINAGYNWSPQIHAIRRQVGKGLDRKSPALRYSYGSSAVCLKLDTTNLLVLTTCV